MPSSQPSVNVPFASVAVSVLSPTVSSMWLWNVSVKLHEQAGPMTSNDR